MVVWGLGVTVRVVWVVGGVYEGVVVGGDVALVLVSWRVPVLVVGSIVKSWGSVFKGGLGVGGAGVLGVV